MLNRYLLKIMLFSLLFQGSMDVQAKKKKKSKNKNETTSKKVKYVKRGPVLIAENGTHLGHGLFPTNWRKRDDKTFKVGLVYYGDFWKKTDLDRIAPKVEKAFEQASQGLIHLNIAYLEAIPFKNRDLEISNMNLEHVKDIKRLKRLFHYENKLGSSDFAKEVFELAGKTPLGSKFSELDGLLVVTGAQFEGLGVAVGRIGLTEQPREIAWGIDGNSVDIASDEEIVDELLHEWGHVMHFGHAAYQCNILNLKTNDSVKQCCIDSPNGNDVMSYCRDRVEVNHVAFFGYEQCHLKLIQNEIIPRLERGGKKVFANGLCE
jgi:hypothetical protein